MEQVKGDVDKGVHDGVVPFPTSCIFQYFDCVSDFLVAWAQVSLGVAGEIWGVTKGVFFASPW